MPSSKGFLRVAVLQSPPVYGDLKASLDTLEGLLAGAARHEVDLVVVGETWLPGYPAWLDYCPEVALWNHEPTKEVFAHLRQNSLVVDGVGDRMLSRLAARHRVVLAIGVHERVDAGPGNGTLYNSLLIYDADGRLANHHRKLVPTFTERLVWGPGDADALRAVDTRAGRVGGLICWEHWMPLARQALHLSGETVHVAVWPTVSDLHLLASRHYAIEGRTFVIAAGSLMRVRDLPPQLEPRGEIGGPDDWLLRGGSTVIAPDGSLLMEQVFDRSEILVAELDLAHADREKLTLDVAGHYSRPELLELGVRRQGRVVERPVDEDREP